MEGFNSLVWGGRREKGGMASPPRNWVNCSEFSVNLHAAACKLTSMTVLTVLARQLGNCTDCLQRGRSVQCTSARERKHVDKKKSRNKGMQHPQRLHVTAPASLAAAICIRIFVLTICLVDGFTIQRHVQSTPQHNTASSRA
jgi:hypothetical protein